MGPFGTVAAVGGRWVVGLTAEGRAEVERFLAEYGGRSARLLAGGSFRSAVAFAVRAGLTWEEIEAACRDGLSRAVAGWRPDRGAALASVASWWMRSRVQRAAERRSRCHRQTGGEERQDAAVGEKGRERLTDLIPARPDPDLDPEVRDRRRAVAAAVREAMRFVAPRDAEIFRVRAGIDGEPRTLQQTADLFGLSRERVRYIEDRVRTRLYRELKGLYAEVAS